MSSERVRKLLIAFVLTATLVYVIRPANTAPTRDPQALVTEIASKEKIQLTPVPHLKGTAPLNLPSEVLAIQYEQIQNYFLKAISKARRERDELWKPDFSSAEAYRRSTQPHRDRLREMLGLVDLPSHGSAQTAVLSGGDVHIESVTIPLDGEFAARGLVFSRGGRGKAIVVAIPDAQQTPEEFEGISEGSSATWLATLLNRDVVVCIPQMIERTEDHTIAQLAVGQRMSRRRLLHRLGFIVGRTLVGMEVQQVSALRRYLAERFNVRPAAVMGQGQGGMTALYAAATDPEWQSAVVIDYFQRREWAWEEPVDRMLYGQIKEFGDAEVVALIAPRALTILTSHGGPVSVESVTPELQRARRFYDGLSKGGALAADLVRAEVLDEAVARIAGDTNADKKRAPIVFSLTVSHNEVQKARNEHFHSMHEYLRQLNRESDQVRIDRWDLEGTSPSERAAKAEQLRAELRKLMGVTGPPEVLINARTRLIRVTDRFAAYEVLLDAAPDLQVYGQLLVPRDIDGRRPAVVVQHGLGGEPRDVTGLGVDADTVYHEFARKIAEEGYVVFAPYITTTLPTTVTNRLVRQAAMLGRMRTSVEFLKLQRIVDFLQSLPVVDKDHLGYYGLSYGGYAAIWMPPLEPRLKLTVISGHFNDWRNKITNEVWRGSYMRHPDEDFFNWDVLRRFTHRELIAAMWPRPAMVEFAERDGTTKPEWHARAWNEVEQWAKAWEVPDKYVRDHFDGVHEIHGVKAISFLDRWLRPEQASGRDYVYDLRHGIKTNQSITEIGEGTLPFVSMDVDASEETRVRGTFNVAATDPNFRGFALKVSRAGNPGPLVMRFGASEGGNDIGEARLASTEILPLYDLRYEARVPAVRLDPNVLYHFEVRAESGSRYEADHYVLYGPRPLGGKAYPQHFGLSFDVLTGNEAKTVQHREDRFEFARRLMSSYEGGEPVGKLDSGPREGEVEITSQWIIYTGESSGEVIDAAEEDLREFLSKTMNVNVGSARKGGKRSIELWVESEVEGVNSSEGFRIAATKDRVVVSGTTPLGVMRGVYQMEEDMRVRRGPFVSRGSILKNSRFPIRLTMPFLSGGAKYTETSRPLEYTDGLLRRISHDGFNAIWLWINTEEATMDSRIFPEFNEPDAARRFERLRDVTERARRVGIDVYLYLATGYHHHLPGNAYRFFDRHPEMRGYGWGIPLCTSNKKVRDYYAETVKTIFREVPVAKGLIVIYDSEGFYYCGNNNRRRLQCPRCRHHSQPYLADQLLRTLYGAMKEQGGADKEFIAWNYDNESEWVYETLPLLPKDIMIENNFAKGAIVERDGIRHRTGDYNITSVGPPALFVKLYEAARAQQLRFIAKTEHAISQEFIFTPYIPAMEQFFRRIEKIREFDLAGWFGNWSHYGYTPSPNARLIREMSFDPAPSMEDVLRRLALRDFGSAAAPHVLAAWHQFSEAIRQYPYSDDVARLPGPIQKGPSQPLFLDPEVESFGRWRAWQNDLEWAEPWGPEITAKYLGKVQEGFARGIADLKSALQVAEGPDREAVESLWRVAKTIDSSLVSTLHLMRWIPRRDEFMSAETAESRREELRSQLAGIAAKERENALQILPVLDQDSRLGYASAGGGVVRGGLFSPALVRWKIGHIDDLLLRRLPMAMKRAPIEEKHF